MTSVHRVADGYQCRFYSRDPDDEGWGMWQPCSKSDAHTLLNRANFQVRAVFAAPIPDFNVADEIDTWKHIANEWADAATNALQWIRNINEEISPASDAIKFTEENIRHCMEVQSAAKKGKS